MMLAPGDLAGSKAVDLAERGTLDLIRKLDIFQNSAYIGTVNGMTGIM
jgi:hypothetical protein